jgi:hypothetical protein
MQIARGVIYRFTGWSDGPDSNPRIVDVPATATTFVAVYQAVGIVPPVTVTDVRAVPNHGSIGSFVVTFSAALNPATAQNPAGYWVILPGHDHRFGTRDDRIVRIRKAAYQAGSKTVKLTPAARLSDASSIELGVSGSLSKPHPTDVWGRPIDGNGDGAPGGNFVVIVGPPSTKAKVRLRRAQSS